MMNDLRMVLSRGWFQIRPQMGSALKPRVYPAGFCSNFRFQISSYFHPSILRTPICNMGTLSPVDEKRASDDQIEDITKKTPAGDDEDFTPEERRKIIRRIDMRLVTMTGLAYCISLMDRTNLSMAAVAG